MKDGPMTEENHPEPITEQEFQMAMMLVSARFPNCKFVIEKYVEQRIAERDEARRDVELAADELLLPIPEPGSDMSRLMIANRLLHRAIEEAQRERDEARKEAEDWRQVAMTYVPMAEPGSYKSQPLPWEREEAKGDE